MLRLDDWEVVSVLIPLVVLFLMQFIARLWRKGKGTSLLEAVIKGDKDAVKTLLATGAHVDAREPFSGRTPLIFAAADGHTEIVRSLVHRGADMSARDIYGWTALMYASSSGYHEIVRILREAGAEE